MDTYLKKVKREEIKKLPVSQIQKGISLLESIDQQILSKMSNEDLNIINNDLLKMENIINQIKNKIDNNTVSSTIDNKPKKLNIKKENYEIISFNDLFDD
ncbi:hypothetical protein [Massilimicrobiota sp. An134]|uniref:hypothetical protein n=1 Tax=Massilimicrobiota sp. An134 TaxID=1965557 RepID=UPI000B3A86E1|nr:hypothetical protein [Massilimicrobiota sp. An134]OUQ24295.1 hypothetical protein B5E79_12555 [Massilimicrobiota sp. An134]